MVTAKHQQREARQLFRLCLVNGVVDEHRVRQIVHRGVAGGRSGSLGVMSRFLRLVRLERSRHDATVESAVPLPPVASGPVLQCVISAEGRSRRAAPAAAIAVSALACSA
jgi:F-type H+-transporting ATPase subunit delta